MKNKRLRNYLQQRADRKKELKSREEIQNNPDKHIDQDFSGFPHAPAKEEVILPRSKQERNGEKVIDPPAKQRNKNSGTDESRSDGSANAFEGTETVRDDE